MNFVYIQNRMYVKLFKSKNKDLQMFIKSKNNETILFSDWYSYVHRLYHRTSRIYSL
ncbi:hypothetical protein KL86DYS1_31802 [uncultured Dysgonomonas sp.]|uniref:Uncharacterized protein n=1 Tax=uncultured Dysgonomonas sp. TaxID=206096 RepID=A0A212K8C2_9BACT|nr:hypothetical protein KL86DYS1_31802 [uncultured Dysgonomonas sp.]